MMKKLSLLVVFYLIDASVVFAADCATVAKRVATEQGGTVKSTTPIVENGKNKCVVVVFVPSQNGEKPRRVEVAVPAS